MSCDAVRPRIRPFLDDLLDERDYQDIHEHLEACAPCHSYASSVGTLSFRLYELGKKTALPPDMVSTILYESRKEEAPAPAVPEEPGPPPEGVFFSKRDLVWALVAVVAALTAVSYAVSMVSHQDEHKAQGAPASLMPVAPADSGIPEGVGADG